VPNVSQATTESSSRRSFGQVLTKFVWTRYPGVPDIDLVA
jgi:hypothetical protein